MTVSRRAFVGGALVAAGLAAATRARAAGSIIAATFGDPVPTQWAAHDGTLAKASGWDLQWRTFNSGADVIAAMASGDVKIGELGSSPLAIAATQGVDIEMFMIDYVIGTSESLIVRNGTGIKTLADLKGKRVATPVGSTSHFSLMGALQHANVPANDVQIMSMPPNQIAAAWSQDAIDAAFIWPPVQTELLKNGTRLVGADTVASWGFPTFNAWVVNRDFAKANRAGLIGFIRAVNEANAAYLKNPAAWTPASAQVKAIAAATGAAPEQVPDVIQGYQFLPIAEQLQPQWMGGGIAKTLKATADFLKSVNRLDHVLPSYADAVTTAYLKEAVG
ncbi:MAG: taurine ABC transporter substrate-binding protein [Proteobacteria bacterium]|nr:taurine ABC transporter substrate-binding protein [Pseudomonadota bacterium]